MIDLHLKIRCTELAFFGHNIISAIGQARPTRGWGHSQHGSIDIHSKSSNFSRYEIVPRSFHTKRFLSVCNPMGPDKERQWISVESWALVSCSTNQRARHISRFLALLQQFQSSAHTGTCIGDWPRQSPNPRRWPIWIPQQAPCESRNSLREHRKRNANTYSVALKNSTTTFAAVMLSFDQITNPMRQFLKNTC